MASISPVQLFVALALFGITTFSAKAGTEPPVDPKADANLQNAVSFPPLSSSWTFGAGYQWREMGSLGFHTGSAAAHQLLPWMAGGSSHSSSSTNSSPMGDPNAAGSAGSIANRNYSDGYVNEDGGTPFTGDTWYWGYENASQLSGTTLSYHSTYGTAVTTTTTATSSTRTDSSSLAHDLGWSSDVSGSGWYATLGSPAIYTRGALSVSLELGYSFATSDNGAATPDVFQASQSSVQTVTRSSVTTTTMNQLTDTYDVTGLKIPAAPYSGSLAGPGPLISNTPSARNISSSSASTGSSQVLGRSVQTADFLSNVNESLRIRLNTVSFGPHLNWDAGRFNLGWSAGFALNIADWDSGYAEDLYVRQGGGAYRLFKTYPFSSSGCDVLPGGYTELNALFRVTQHWSVFAGGRYDWAGTLHGDAGPSSFGFHVRGVSVQGGVTFVF